MSAIPASSVSLKTMADGTLRISFDVEPSNAQDAFRLFAAPGTQVAIAALVDGSFLAQKTQVEAQAPVPRPHLGNACYRTVLWCYEHTFWDWISSQWPDWRIKSAADAKAFVCWLCGIESRKELDTDNEANKTWHRLIREPYRLFLQSHDSENTTQRIFDADQN